MNAKLSEDLVALGREAGGRDLSVGDIEQALKGRGFAVVVLLLTLPFCTPVPLPVISTPVGLAVAVMGVRLAVGQKPWLPDFILGHKISGSTLVKVLESSGKVARWLETVVKPRWSALQFRGSHFLEGAAISASGVVLAMPLALPLTNSIPAWAIVLLTLGRMGKDGVLLTAGYVVSVMAWVYLGAITFFGAAALQGFWGWLIALL